MPFVEILIFTMRVYLCGESAPNTLLHCVFYCQRVANTKSNLPNYVCDFPISEFFLFCCYFKFIDALFCLHIGHGTQ